MMAVGILIAWTALTARDFWKGPRARAWGRLRHFLYRRTQAAIIPLSGLNACQNNRAGRKPWFTYEGWVILHRLPIIGFIFSTLTMASAVILGMWQVAKVMNVVVLACWLITATMGRMNRRRMLDNMRSAMNMRAAMNFEQDAAEWKIRHAFGASMIDPRSSIKITDS